MINVPKYLYVGCGNHRMEGFTHVEIDYAKRFSKNTVVPEPEILCDITENIPVRDNSIEIIFSRETLEHLKYRELLNHLIECHRILKIGGIVRIAVPDLDHFVKKFIERKSNIDEEIKHYANDIDPDFPITNHSELFVKEIMYHDHFYNHNFETMSNCLKIVGFEEISRNRPGDIHFDNEIIKSSITIAEENREELLIMTAKKTKQETNIKKINLKKKINILNTVFEKFLNLHLKPANHRKAHFPQKNFFLEKIHNLRKYL